jgi:ribonucleoside-diphosphate reductase alpha chain
MRRLGIPKERYDAPGFSLLRELGFRRSIIEQATEVICGRMTIEGAPFLRDEHLPVFDCASRCGRHGKRFIHPTGHLRMMAAAQPFISGAISKTVNLPKETTIEEVGELYRYGWELGLKAIAIYRDGCKMSQPLASSSSDGASEDAEEVTRQAIESAVAEALAEAEQNRKPRRTRLPKKRSGFTQEARVGGHKVYLRTGEYEDGEIGEIFIDMHKEGAAFRSMMNCFAIAVSLGLQYGVPLDEFVEVFTFTRFEPHGHTDHPNVRFSTSVVDYVFRVLAMEYLGRHELVQVPPTTPGHDGRGSEGRGGAGAKGDPKVEPKGDRPAGRTPAGSRPKADVRATVSADAAPVASSDARAPRGGGAAAARPQPAARVTEGPAPDTEVDDGAETEPVASATNGSGRGHANGNGHGNGNGATTSVLDGPRIGRVSSTVTDHLTQVSTDAPMCDMCGHLTVRNGSCYKCLNCGQSMGCS